MLVRDVTGALALDTPSPRVERAAGSGEAPDGLGMGAGELSALVADLAPLREPVYWADLLVTSGAAYGAFWLAMQSAHERWLDAAFMLVSTCAVYRMTLFTHELAHAPQRALRGFRVLWHVVCGVPLLVPAFLYEMHGTHHDRRFYASSEDGEYRAFALAPRAEAFAHVAGSLFAVPALVVRFLVLAPLGWLVPPLRRFVLRKVSSLVIDFNVSRVLPQPLPGRWALQELACFVWCSTLLASTLWGWLDPALLLRGYIVVTGAVAINAARVLCAHRYRSDGNAQSYVEQVLDSNNFPRGLAWLWAPLGLRYHAVHHLFPKLPYHALGEAYRRLMRAFPPESAFRRTDRSSFLAGLDDVIGRRREEGLRS